MSAIPPAAWRAAAALRALPASMMVIHGVYRIVTGGVTGFGEYLGSMMPLGPVMAWLLSIVEVSGGLTLISGRFVRPLCWWFSAELTMGILLVHRPSGWFVVGGGRNGMEYSVLLICCFLIVSVLDPALRGAARPETTSS